MDERQIERLLGAAGAQQQPSAAFEESLLMRLRSEFELTARPLADAEVQQNNDIVVDIDPRPQPAPRPGRRWFVPAAAAGLITIAVAGLIVNAGRTVEQRPAATTPPLATVTTTATETTVEPVGTESPASTAPESTLTPSIAAPIPDAATFRRLSTFCAETLPPVSLIAEVAFNFGDTGEDPATALLLLRSALDEVVATLDEIAVSGIDVAAQVAEADTLDRRVANFESEVASGRINSVRSSLPTVATDLITIVTDVAGFDISQCSPTEN